MDTVLGGLEWDEAKRQETLRARGLDFADVALVDPGSIQTERDLRMDYGEARFNSTGLSKWAPLHVLLDAEEWTYSHYLNEEGQ